MSVHFVAKKIDSAPTFRYFLTAAAIVISAARRGNEAHRTVVLTTRLRFIAYNFYTFRHYVKFINFKTQSAVCAEKYVGVSKLFDGVGTSRNLAATSRRGARN
jgi:hypothetical protein